MKGEEKLSNGDQEPIKMILLIEVRWPFLSEGAGCTMSDRHPRTLHVLESLRIQYGCSIKCLCR